MKTETLQDSLETYREKIRGSRRNPAAAYELALRSQRADQPGDQVSYYVAGTGKRVKVHEAAKPASQWDPQNPDENVEYYKAKLVELEGKFRPFFEGRSRRQRAALLALPSWKRGMNGFNRRCDRSRRREEDVAMTNGVPDNEFWPWSFRRNVTRARMPQAEPIRRRRSTR
jgi:hypothetical protein